MYVILGQTMGPSHNKQSDCNLIYYMWIFFLSSNPVDQWTDNCLGFNDPGRGTIKTPPSGASD